MVGYFFWFVIGLLIVLFFGFLFYKTIKLFKMIIFDDSSMFNNSFLFSNKEDVIIQNLLLVGVLYLGVYFCLLNARYGNFLASKTILLYTCIMSLVVAFSFKVLIANMLGIVGIVIWWIYNVVGIGKDFLHQALLYSGMIFLFIIYYFIGRLLEIYKGNSNNFYKKSAICFTRLGVAGLCLVLCIESSLDVSPQSTNAIAMVIAELGKYWKPFMQVCLFALASFSIMITAVFSKKIEKIELFANFAIFILFIHYLLLVQSTFVVYLFSFLFNILSFAYLGWVIFLGYLRKEATLITFGIYGSLIYMAYKYTVWLESFLNKSLFFIISGVIFLSFGYIIEKFRKKLLEKIEETGNNDYAVTR